MANYNVLTVVLLAIYLLPLACLACSKSRKKLEFETKLCSSSTGAIYGFPGRISEHALKNPMCRPLFSSAFETESTVANWWLVLDHKNRWAHCPPGHFLQGFKFTKGESGLYALEEGRCTKSTKYYARHDDCKIKPTHQTRRCDRGYFLAGIYKGNCCGWSCVTQLKCCKPPTTLFKVDSVETAKEKVMVRSARGLAELAWYLGYEGTKGCYGEKAGDNFEQDGTTWKAKKCQDKNNPQLKITYGDWSLSMSNVKYSNSKTTELIPQTIDSGVLRNDSPTPVTETIIRRDVSIRSVKHTVTSHWKVSVGIGMKVSYSAPFKAGGMGGEFSFNVNAEGGRETQDETGNIQERSLEVVREKDLWPHSAYQWTARMYKTRTTQYYRATVRVECTAKFNGNLRKGGGSGAHDTNYHTRYTGQKASNVEYQFGNKNKPFYVAVKEESEQWSNPWMWGDVLYRRPLVKELVGNLTEKKHYEFVLEGKFDDIQGYKVELEFGNHTKLPRPTFDDYDDTTTPVFDFNSDVLQGRDKAIVADEGPDDEESGFTPVYD
ncbi:uncharacterized protein LOC101847822 [Aplysia californica]|uniref:Uncharacterized protein LOC101847822 n=1 Tax=Aplysia californica TaxID=6500 RepID=A0ABM0JQ75_APLCA|nr:uncharacterized protein LOC101847822 [Aplysia californica]